MLKSKKKVTIPTNPINHQDTNDVDLFWEITAIEFSPDFNQIKILADTYYLDDQLQKVILKRTTRTLKDAEIDKLWSAVKGSWKSTNFRESMRKVFTKTHKAVVLMENNNFGDADIEELN